MDVVASKSGGEAMHAPQIRLFVLGKPHWGQYSFRWNGRSDKQSGHKHNSFPLAALHKMHGCENSIIFNRWLNFEHL